MNLNAERVTCFFAHSDDEMVAAGTLHRLVRQGADVEVVCFGPCAIESDREGGKPSVAVVQAEWFRSLELIGAAPGIDPVHGWGMFLPSKSLAERGQRIADYMFHHLEKRKPDCILTLSPHDENPAHAVVGVQAERVARGRVDTVIRCDMPWNFSMDRPNLYVRLEGEDFACKIRVIEAYQSQAWRYDYKNMLTNYAWANGQSVKAGQPCEVFTVIRSVL